MPPLHSEICQNGGNEPVGCVSHTGTSQVQLFYYSVGTENSHVLELCKIDSTKYTQSLYFSDNAVFNLNTFNTIAVFDWSWS